MTNEEWLKNKICERINSLSTPEFYEYLTDGLEHFCSGMCKYCEPIFGHCPEMIESDDICKERFTIWCNQTHYEKGEQNADI